MKKLLAVLGPTATGKSALGLTLAERLGGEIISCDSTAVYRGFDIGTDKLPLAERRGIPHHLIDIADPTDEYTAAQFARDASAIVRDVHARGKVPILVGGTGFYYRALTRGLFPGPGKDAALRSRLERIAEKRGVERLHRLVDRVDPESALRIQPRDLKRLIRALEVYFQTGRPLTAHFEATVSLLDSDVEVVPIGLRMPAAWLAERLAARVDAQFDAGLLEEIRSLLAAGVPPDARPFGGQVYRITSTGVATLLAAIGLDTEGLDIAPLGVGFGSFDGQLIVASEGAGQLRAISPAGIVTLLPVFIPNGPEELTFVPLNLGASGNPVGRQLEVALGKCLAFVDWRRAWSCSTVPPLSDFWRQKK